MFDNKYPYTDYHEMNLDWFLGKFKELVATWEQVQSDWNSLHDYVQDYFDNLNVQTEIDNKINAMIADGSFAIIITPLVEAALPTIVDGKLPAVVASQIGAVVAAQIDAVVAGQLPAVAASAAATEVGDWLAAHINPDTGYVIDDTLTVSQAAADAKTVGDNFSDINSDIAEIESHVHFLSSNLYDSSLQTPDTISPHYYVNGEPYSSTAFDNQYNCTALFEIEPDTQYTIGLVPPVLTYVKPWADAGQGIFFYDRDGNYITGTSNNTFTTPVNAKYARFNYFITRISLTALNNRCVLVKGNTLPESYIAYNSVWIDDIVDDIKDVVDDIHNPINYKIDADGDGVSLFAKYNSTHDIVIECRKKGGNDLFDINKVGLIANSTSNISDDNTDAVYFIDATTDFHSPFKMSAINNIDGDDPTHNYFTGGNHQYNNQESGSTPTARGILLKFEADNIIVTEGSGSCRSFTMTWINNVQAYNTRKADGTGREVLTEKHIMKFDGHKLDTWVELIPLEDVSVEIWYGIQWTTSAFPYAQFVGATNRQTYNDEACDSGNRYACHYIGYSDSTHNELDVSIDPDYDLGDHKYYTTNQSMFITSYHKGYCWIIRNTNLTANLSYFLRGSYEFKYRNI